MLQSHNYSLRSRGQVNDDGPQVTTYSEAINRNLMELSRSTNANKMANRQENQAAQGRDGGTGQATILNPMEYGPTEDVPKRRESFIKAVTCDVDTGQLLAEVRELRARNSRNEKMIEDLKRQLDESKAFRKEITQLLTNELKVKDGHIQKLHDVNWKNIEEFTSQVARSREVYDEQIKNLAPQVAVIMASFIEENRNENEQAIEMLSSQTAEVMHLLENKP